MAKKDLTTREKYLSDLKLVVTTQRDVLKECFPKDERFGYPSAAGFEERLGKYTWSMRSGLEEGIRDFDEDNEERYGPEFVAKIRQRLHEQHGIDLDDLVGSHGRVARRVLKRGRVHSHDEARSLKAYVISLSETEEKAAKNRKKIERAGEIIGKFEAICPPEV